LANGGRPVYCAQCGSVVAAGDNFCGVCGARVSPSALESAPTQQMPTPSYAPPRASGGGNSRARPLILGLAVVLLVLMGIGVIVGFALVGGDGTSAPRSSANEPAPAEDPEPTRQNANNSAEDSQPPTEQELGVGDSVEVEGIEATLNEVRVLPATDLDRPIQNPDNRFLAADVTFENVSEGAVSVSSLLEFVLKNEEGYSASQTVHTQQRELAEGEIAPGEKASGEIVYEVPPKSRGLQLDYTLFVRGGTYTWAIGDLQDVAIAPRPKEPRPPTPEATSPTPEPTTPAQQAAVEPTPVVETAPAPIRFRIDSEPKRAKVQYEGRLLGVTPVELPVPPAADGRASVRLTFMLEGYQRITTIAAGEGPEVRFSQKLSKKKSGSRSADRYKEDPY